MQAYTYDIKYKTSEANANANCLSHLLVKRDETIDVVDIFYVGNLLTLPVTAQEILEEYKNDQQILKVINALKNCEKLSKVDTWKCNVEDFCLE